MKKAIILLALIFTVTITFAQKGKVSSAQNLKESGKLAKALEAINETINPENPKSEKTINWPNTWEVRGEIYQAIAQSKDENIRKLCSDPLNVAFESYQKALKLDTKGRNANSIKIKLTLLANELSNHAVAAYNNQDYKKALSSFEKVIEIQNIDVVKADNPEAVDTVIIFNTALVAYYAEDYDKAIKYYKEAAKYGYNGAKTYSLLSGVYQAKGDTLGALEIVKEGYDKYPEDQSVLESLIQLYMEQDKSEDAMTYLEKAIANNPKVPRYYFAQGSLYEKLDQFEKAVKTYQKCIELDPEFFNGYYNLGALYYNKGVKQSEVALAVPANDNAKYEAEMKKADEWFAKSLPYMEKCYELNPEENMTLESLKNLYYRLKKMDKYNEILEKLGQ
ncbi:MAG: hypothetical protein CR996_01970 [Draconibacterium sp.]|nr:MAG: hypothetical protein CR996_01970 [Draconibacterium sp.]PIF05081.1 MAG: hypothetical protein CSA36_08580 [Draconibacterium sp.]